ncbi:MAG TPA: methyltransferase domain-containing protein, partial [Paraburkholderia sp.]|nr:methyltransferase domain-containing protein [Paraburkholderia sp.]
YILPYEDSTFDAVLSSGVLEHVAFEQKSLDQIWRVLKDDGLFIITFLPNKFSVTENASRALKTYRGHNRLYGLNEARNTFLRSGFVVVSCGYHQVFPTFSKGVNGSVILNPIVTAGAKMNRAFERIPGVNRVSANLFFVLRRVSQM